MFFFFSMERNYKIFNVLVSSAFLWHILMDDNYGSQATKCFGLTNFIKLCFHKRLQLQLKKFISNYS